MKKLIIPTIVMASAITGVAFAQTAAPKPPVHHAATATTGPLTPKNIPPAHGIVKTAYALKYVDTKIGTGAPAPPTGFFTVQYTGWLASDGKKFDSSLDRPEPFTFPAGAHRVIPGWDTGFAGMRIGGKRRLFIPYQLAYGEIGHPPVIPAKSDLIFDIELVAVSDKPPAPKTAPAAPPAATPAPASSTQPSSTAPAATAPAGTTAPPAPSAPTDKAAKP